MLTLSGVAFELACQWIHEHGRPLEVALLAHAFEDGPREAVLDALRAYRNPDGGFGRALEPDLRAPGSSGLATSIAIAHLAAVGCPADDPLVTGVSTWGRSVFGREGLIWPLLPEASNDYPHAPWWHDEQGSVARSFLGFRIVPRAKMLAGLWPYADEMSHAFLELVTEDAVRAIETAPEDALWVDAYAEAVELAEVPGLRPAWRERIARRLAPLAVAHVTRDPAQWTSYCVPPLRLAPTPYSVLATALADIVPVQLDWIITHQSEDGAWEPTWDWRGSYPDEWAQARVEWRGILTLETLRALNAYGRIEADD